VQKKPESVDAFGERLQSKKDEMLTGRVDTEADRWFGSTTFQTYQCVYVMGRECGWRSSGSCRELRPGGEGVCPISRQPGGNVVKGEDGEVKAKNLCTIGSSKKHCRGGGRIGGQPACWRL